MRLDNRTHILHSGSMDLSVTRHRKQRNTRQCGSLLLLVMAFMIYFCGPGDKSLEVKPLADLPHPDLSRLDKNANFPVERQKALEEATQKKTVAEKSVAFGRLGMLYHAYHLHAAALTCYENAHLLDDADTRWLYLKGLVYKELGRQGEALAALTATVQKDPENAAAQVILAELEFQEGHFDRAKALFNSVLKLDADQTAALVGLGKIASLEKKYREAVNYFQKALDLEPEATVVHYLLGLSYRDLGDEAKAEKHLALRGEGQPSLADPLLVEVESLRNDAEAMRRRGNEEATAGRFGEALEYFNEALKMNATDARIWINVGVCYRQLGDLEAALHAYQRVLEYSENPSLSASAYYRIGDIYDRTGRSGVEQYKKALEIHPDDLGSLFRYAECLRQEGLLEESLPYYEKLIEIRPDLAPSRMGRALTLIRLERWEQALQTLVRDLETMKQEPAFAHLLARILAACPLDKVRDGAKAWAITQQLARVMDNADLTATIAMTLAEQNRFAEAVETQRKAIDQANAKGQSVDFLQETLLGYQRKQPCRKPWPSDDPLFRKKLY